MRPAGTRVRFKAWGKGRGLGAKRSAAARGSRDGLAEKEPAMTNLPTRRRILLVEDEMIIAMMLEDLLADLGYSVVAIAARSDEALAIIEAQSIDAAILDLNLAGQRSDSVADSLAARDIPFVFSTGYGEQGLKPEHRDRPLLKKPFRSADLERILASLFDHPS
jgi:CheY-like chemotaxis protein